MKTIFEMPESIWKDAYLNVVSFYRQYPVEYHSIDECVNDHSLYTEEHHITPLWFYKQAKVEPDNSKSNIIRLPYYWHIMIHVYLCRYFRAIKDESNLIKAVNAVWCFIGRAKHHVRKCINLPTFTKTQIEELERLKIEALHGKHDKKYTYEQMVQFRDDYNRFGCEYVRDHDGFKGKNPYALVRQFKNWNLSFNKRECHQWTKKEVDELWNLCHNFGFQYVFANKLVPSKMTSHHQINKVFWRYGKPQLPSGLPKKKPTRRKNLTYYNTGKIAVNNGVIQRFVDPTSIPPGWKIGRLPLAPGKGTKGKIRISNKLTNEVRIVSANTPLPSADWEYGNHKVKGTIKITDGIRNRMFSKDQPIPLGWRHGTSYAGCKWMNNGIKEETVLESEQDERLQNGWKFGRLWSPKKESKQH